MALIIRNNRWPMIQAQLRLANKSKVAVGFPSDSPGSTASHGNGMNNVQVALANEIGSAPGVRPVVPSRPFVKQAFSGSKRDPFLRNMKKMLGMISQGNMSTLIALERIGRMGESRVKEEITHGQFAPNTAFTVNKKGSDKPLIDSGKMRAAVTYKVRMRGTAGGA